MKIKSMLKTSAYITNDYNRMSTDQSLIDEGCAFLSLIIPDDPHGIIGRDRQMRVICRCRAIIEFELTAIYDSIYMGQKYKVDFLLPLDYPFKPPKVIFKTPIDHINICDLSGLVTHSFLGKEWSPIGLRILILEILQLFTTPRPQDLIPDETPQTPQNSPTIHKHPQMLTDIDFLM